MIVISIQNKKDMGEERPIKKEVYYICSQTH